MNLIGLIKPKNGVVFLILLMGVLLTGYDSINSDVEKKPAPYRLGILVGINSSMPSVEGFKAEFAEQGYREDENIIFDIQLADSDKTSDGCWCHVPTL